ncbi:MAG: S8 family peptidase [Gemmatimonadaceae bacterium]
MRLRRPWLEELIFGKDAARRFTQDSPVLPDVWIEFGLQYTDPDRGPDEPRDLLLTPHRGYTPAELGMALRLRLNAERKTIPWKQRHPNGSVAADIAYNQAAVAARLHFDELVRVVLPMSKWWHDHVRYEPAADLPRAFTRPEVQRELATSIEAAQKGQVVRPETPPVSADLLWMIHLVGTILLAGEVKEPATEPLAKQAFDKLNDDEEALVAAFATLMHEPLRDEKARVWLVSHDRAATTAVWRSTLAVKSDAAQRVFKLDCSNISWAILDSGIDARHPAFWKRDDREKPRLKTDGAAGRKLTAQEADAEWPAHTRVRATYDFTRIRQLLNTDNDELRLVIRKLKADLTAKPSDPRAARWQRDLAFWAKFRSADPNVRRQGRQLRRSLRTGRSIDWDAIKPFIEIPHAVAEYESPRHEHGTHVAGILAADWRMFDWEPGDRHHPGEHDLVGVCPDINLYDLRVLDDEGRGNEFTIMAALQFIRHLNAHREQPLIHGVNMSLAIPHDKANYACGRTPVCDESERVIGTGVVVVAAAGNKGYIYYATPAGGAAEGYAAISIQDPGNAENVITVGATHRYQPHTYGVSYFSSRGPTGDGRRKPDLVAPGEKILGPIPGNGSKTKDGTSMAAPHVSGAVALLLARHRELLGNPRRIKEILCTSATDLGRERDFQGYGMVDILRALQSV